MSFADATTLSESDARAFGSDARVWPLPDSVTPDSIERVLVARGAIDVVFGEQCVAAFFPASDAIAASRYAPLRARARESARHELPVRYDGLDLDEIARTTGLTASSIVSIHSRAEYTVTMVGFAPGFAYLRGLDERLHLPRRRTPRDRVPREALAIGGPYSGIYPTAMPGGWNLLGTYVGERLFDPSAGALLRVGDRVAFQESDRAPRIEPGSSPDSAAPTMTDGVEVVNVAGVASIQDTGRTGVLSMGLSRGGHVAPSLARRVNGELGNAESAACIEGFGRVTLRAKESVQVSCGRGVADLRRGQELTVETTSEEPEYYIGVQGGFDVPSVLGGRGTHIYAGIGGYAGRTLRRGDVVAVAREGGGTTKTAEPIGDTELGREEQSLSGKLILSASPYEDDAEWARWLESSSPLELTVDVRARNRVGVPLLSCKPLATLPATPPGRASRPMRPGAVQVTPGGRIFVLGPEHPTIGGYPLIGVVSGMELERLYRANGSRRFGFCAGHA